MMGCGTRMKFTYIFLVASLATGSEQTRTRQAATNAPDPAANSAQSCDNPACSKVGALKRCKRCKEVRYCSRECQKADWKAHKHLCTAPEQDEQGILRLSPWWTAHINELTAATRVCFDRACSSAVHRGENAPSGNEWGPSEQSYWWGKFLHTTELKSQGSRRRQCELLLDFQRETDSTVPGSWESELCLPVAEVQEVAAAVAASSDGAAAAVPVAVAQPAPPVPNANVPVAQAAPATSVDLAFIRAFIQQANLTIMTASNVEEAGADFHLTIEWVKRELEEAALQNRAPETRATEMIRDLRRNPGGCEVAQMIGQTPHRQVAHGPFWAYRELAFLGSITIEGRYVQAWQAVPDSARPSHIRETIRKISAAQAELLGVTDRPFQPLSSDTVRLLREIHGNSELGVGPRESK